MKIPYLKYYKNLTVYGPSERSSHLLRKWYWVMFLLFLLSLSKFMLKKTQCYFLK